MRGGTGVAGDEAGGAWFAAERWNRLNHRGEPVTLLEGPAYAAGAAAAVWLTPGLAGRTRVAGVAAALGAGALGAYDDLYGNADRRGLRGHLSALKSGELTTGGVKLVGIGVLGLACGSLVRRGSVLDKALAGIVVAGAANAVNLLDLRPGRAVKAAALASGPGLLRRALSGTDESGAVPLAAAGLGAAAALLPEDLGERAMLGDAGANALGALLGVAASAGASRAGLAWRAAALTAVTLASEKVSFTRVIAACPPLDALDRLGRRPTATAKLPAQHARGESADGEAHVAGGEKQAADAGAGAEAGVDAGAGAETAMDAGAGAEAGVDAGAREDVVGDAVEAAAGAADAVNPDASGAPDAMDLDVPDTADPAATAEHAASDASAPGPAEPGSSDTSGPGPAEAAASATAASATAASDASAPDPAAPDASATAASDASGPDSAASDASATAASDASATAASDASATTASDASGPDSAASDASATAASGASAADPAASAGTDPAGTEGPPRDPGARG